MPLIQGWRRREEGREAGEEIATIEGAKRQGRKGGREGASEGLTNVLGGLQSLHVRDGQGGNLDVDSTDFSAGIGGLDAAHLEEEEEEEDNKEKRRVKLRNDGKTEALDYSHQ